MFEPKSESVPAARRDICVAITGLTNEHLTDESATLCRHRLELIPYLPVQGQPANLQTKPAHD